MNRLKELRKNRGLTLKQLSKELKEKSDVDITPDALSKYERQERKMSNYEVVKKIARFFCVSTDYLMGISRDCYFCYDRYNDAEFGQSLTVDGAEVKLDLRHKRLLIIDGDYEEFRMLISYCPCCGREL
jgi:transcriptional regulator with XRE-family HTH domain